MELLSRFTIGCRAFLVWYIRFWDATLVYEKSILVCYLLIGKVLKSEQAFWDVLEPVFFRKV